MSDKKEFYKQKLNQAITVLNRVAEDNTTPRNIRRTAKQANDLLIEMRIELNNWKTNILGFRDEMRDAEKEQLKALIRILTVLGGEIEPQSELAQNLSQDDNTPTKPNPARQHKSQNPGEYNE